MNSFLQSVIPEPQFFHAHSRNVDVIKDFDNSFDVFLRSRDWFSVAEFWKRLIGDDKFRNSDRSMPNFLGVKGCSCEYSNYKNPSEILKFDILEVSFTNLSELYDAGMMGEFLSKDERYSKRKTFAVRFAYLGTEYGGYQSQKNLTYPAIAVEDDLRRILGVLP